VSPLVETRTGTPRITAWKCIGCGKIEAPQPCIGICQDRKVELVDGAAYDQLLTRLEQTQRTCEALAAVVRMLAQSTPCAGRWEQSYRHLQQQARQILAGEGST